MNPAADLTRLSEPLVVQPNGPTESPTAAGNKSTADVRLAELVLGGKTLVLVIDGSSRLITRVGSLTTETPWDEANPGQTIDIASGFLVQDKDRVAEALTAATGRSGEATVTARLRGESPVLSILHRITIRDRSADPVIGGIVIRIDQLGNAEERAVLLGLFDQTLRTLSATPVGELSDAICGQINFVMQHGVVDYAELEVRAQSGRGRRWHWTRTDGATYSELPRTVFATHVKTPDPAAATQKVWFEGSDAPCPTTRPHKLVIEVSESMGSGLVTSARAGINELLDDRAQGVLADRTRWLFQLFQQALLRIGTDKVAAGERHRAELMFKQLTDFVMVWSGTGQLLFATRSLGDALGLESHEIPGVAISDIVVDGNNVFEAMKQLGHDESSPTQQWQLRSGDKTRTVEATSINLTHDEYVSGYMTTARDITERLQSSAIDERRNRLSATVATISSRFVNATSVSTSTAVRTALSDISKCCQVERILLWQRQADGLLRVMHEHTLPGVQPVGGVAPGLDPTDLDNLLNTALQGQPELCVDRGHGTEFIRLIEAESARRLGAVLVVGLRSEDGPIGILTFSAEYSEDGTIPALHELEAADTQATMRTIGELIASVLNRAASQEALTFSALHDSLTGLANRRLLLDRAERMLQTAHRRANGIGLLFLDLDDFKTVNDTLGHDAGDELLKDVANRLRRLAVGSTVVARLGGDEFVLLIESPDPERAVTRLAGQVMNELSSLFLIRGRQLAVRVSIGASTVAPGRTQGHLPGDLVRRADMAMYQAKRRGGSSFELFSEWLEEQARRKFNLHEELREAIVKDQLELWFQPQFSLSNNAAVGCEALVRWRHPQKGFVLPNDFIEVAEQAGLINDLGDWVFRKAADGLARLHAEGLADAEFSVAVNVSPLQLIDPELVTRFQSMAAASGVSPKQLTIELTESTLAERDRVIPNLGALRAAGFRTSIDDFGTGFSSLSYLRDLPLDEMKIDRSFIRSLGEDRRDLDMVWALVEMAHSLGLDVVAEGVETNSQRVLLDNMGCNVGQGWLFAKAMPLDDLAALLRAQSPAAAAADRAQIAG